MALQWVLGIGIAVAGVKVLYDLVQSPAPIANEPAKTASSSSSSEPSASIGTDGLPIPPPKPPSSGSATETPMPSAMPSASASAFVQSGQLAQLLASIAQNPKANHPSAVQQDPQTGLILFVYDDLPGLEQPVLAVVPGKADAWLWQFSSDLPVEKIAGATKTEKAQPPRPNATAVKLIGGPFDGAIGIASGDRPRLRVIKSIGFQALEAQEQQTQQGAGGGGAGHGKK